MANKITFDYTQATNFVAQHELEYVAGQVQQAHDLLHDKKGAGSEYAGWLEWPQSHDKAEVARIKQVSTTIREKAEVFIVIGIGGSYMGARSAIELLNHHFYNQLPHDKRQGPEIYFAGQNISGPYLKQLLEIIKDKEVMVNVVSKSGTTLEPALAFRFFRQLLEERYGKKGASQRIIATTDKKSGALKNLADQEGYETFVVPDEVGGRYSVLTPVGLLAMAVSGIDIDAVMAGAAQGQQLSNVPHMADNYCYQYAALRHILYQKGKEIELLINYEPNLQGFAEWWKQLFGESEGKDQKGIFPASANFSTDLHSLGQLIQDGRRNLFATTLWVDQLSADVTIPYLKEDVDGLNYLAHKTLSQVNEKACTGTIMAHVEGGVPNLKINIPEITPFYYGELVYFFQKACGISSYLLGVNPFDQPGVERYKQNMFSLLGKPSK